MLENPFSLDLADLENQTIFVKNVLSDEKAARFFNKYSLKPSPLHWTNEQTEKRDCRKP